MTMCMRDQRAPAPPHPHPPAPRAHGTSVHLWVHARGTYDAAAKRAARAARFASSAASTGAAGAAVFARFAALPAAASVPKRAARFNLASSSCTRG